MPGYPGELADQLVIALANNPPSNPTIAGRFTEIKVPNFNEKKEDISRIVNFELFLIAQAQDLPLIGISSDAMDFIENCYWPENHRQLKKLLYEALLTAKESGYEYLGKNLVSNIYDRMMEGYKRKSDDEFNTSEMEKNLDAINYKRNYTISSFTGLDIQQRIKEIEKGEFKGKDVSYAIIRFNGKDNRKFGNKLLEQFSSIKGNGPTKLARYLAINETDKKEVARIRGNYYTLIKGLKKKNSE
jgi:DNA-binding NtrC family response regulator